MVDTDLSGMCSTECTKTEKGKPEGTKNQACMMIRTEMSDFKMCNTFHAMDVTNVSYGESETLDCANGIDRMFRMSFKSHYVPHRYIYNFVGPNVRYGEKITRCHRLI